MKHVLLPTDFSENSWNAIHYAMHLFKDKSCVFYILNAYTPVIYHVEYVLGYPAQFGLGDAVRNTSQKQLDDLLLRISKEVGKNPKHKFQTMARFDSLISGIKQVTESKFIDLIVMGTKGATGAKEVLFGSNTVQVFKEIKCPILAIPSDFKYDAPQEILFPTDLEVSYKNSRIQLVKEIADTHNSRVNVMHVSGNEDLSTIQEANKAALKILFKEVSYLYHEVAQMDIIEAINVYQIKTKANMLVMINNKHSFFENLFFKSTVNQIGFHLKIPFLVIPSNT